jgi:hypothetical protein
MDIILETAVGHSFARPTAVSRIIHDRLKMAAAWVKELRYGNN